MEQAPSRSGKLVVIAFVALTIAFAAVVTYGMRALRIPPGTPRPGSSAAGDASVRPPP